MILATDQTLEHEFRELIRIPGVAFYEARVFNDNDITPETLRAIGPRIAPTLDLILPGVKLDVVGFGCTSATMTLGEEAVFAEIHKARPDVSCTTPVTAAFAAFRALGARRIGLLTPYSRRINENLANYFERHGVEVAAMATFERQDDREAARISLASIEAGAKRLARAPGVECVFVSCTSLRVAAVVERVEAATGDTRHRQQSRHGLALPAAWRGQRRGRRRGPSVSVEARVSETKFDARVTPARPDIADARLRGIVEAGRYVEGQRRGVIAASAPLRRQPAPDEPLETEALFGETVTVFEEDEGWAWAQLERDSYVGYLPAAALGARRCAHPSRRLPAHARLSRAQHQAAAADGDLVGSADCGRSDRRRFRDRDRRRALLVAASGADRRASNRISSTSRAASSALPICGAGEPRRGSIAPASSRPRCAPAASRRHATAT